MLLARSLETKTDSGGSVSRAMAVKPMACPLSAPKSKKTADSGSVGGMPPAKDMARSSAAPKSKKSVSGGSGMCLKANDRLARPLTPPELDVICTQIQEAQVDRKYSIQTQAGIMQRLSALAVRACDLSHDANEAQRKAAWTRAERIVSRGLKGEVQDDDDVEIGATLTKYFKMAAASLKPVAEFRKEIERFMKAKAAQLPGFAMTERVPSFKPLGLAVIVGEAGNLSNYATERKLWRRLGFGMAPGHEEHAYSTWRMIKGLTSEDWTAAGYSPKRLGQIYGVVTVPLVMHKAKSKYGEVYAKRRARTLETHPEWYLDKNGKPKFDKDGNPRSAHASMDAARIMTKELISDLWSEWRGSVYQLAETPAYLVAPSKSIPAETRRVEEEELV
jgi:hypothetical protein